MVWQEPCERSQLFTAQLKFETCVYLGFADRVGEDESYMEQP